MKRLLKPLAVAALLTAMLAPASAVSGDATPAFVRGKWCYAGPTSFERLRGKSYKRGSCTDKRITFTAYSRFSKWGRTSNECRVETVEDNGRRGDWTISMTCGSVRVKEVFVPVSSNRLDVLVLEEVDADEGC